MAELPQPGPASLPDQQPTPPAETGHAGRERESCVKYFDALWFCYSPVHQMQQYYRFGTVDDCMGKWSELYACLKQRTKFAEEVKDDVMKGKHALWTLRTKEEAQTFWEKEFGFLKTRSSESTEEALQTENRVPGGVSITPDNVSKEAIV